MGNKGRVVALGGGVVERPESPVKRILHRWASMDLRKHIGIAIEERRFPRWQTKIEEEKYSWEAWRPLNRSITNGIFILG